MTMKLQNEYEYATNMAVGKVTDEELYNHVKRVVEQGKYNHLDVRIAHDLKFATMPSSTVCEWYDKYDCNDDHITTLYRRIIKERYPTTWGSIQDVLTC